MGRHLPIAVATLCLGLGPARGEGPEYTFTPRASSGETFVAKSENTLVLTNRRAGRVEATVRQKDVREGLVSILASEGTRATSLTEETTVHRLAVHTEVGGLPIKEPDADGPLKGVILRYDFDPAKKTYKPKLVSGESGPDVSKRLAQTEDFPLNENFLPTVPLSVGQTQTIRDEDRLKKMFKEMGDGVVFAERPRITLESVKDEGGKKIATLRYAVRAQESPTAAGPGRAPMAMAQVATIRYDLDEGYVAEVVSTVSGARAAASAGGADYRFESRTTDSYAKK